MSVCTCIDIHYDPPPSPPLSLLHNPPPHPPSLPNLQTRSLECVRWTLWPRSRGAPRYWASPQTATARWTAGTTFAPPSASLSSGRTSAPSSSAPAFSPRFTRCARHDTTRHFSHDIWQCNTEMWNVNEEGLINKILCAVHFQRNEMPHCFGYHCIIARCHGEIYS